MKADNAMKPMQQTRRIFLQTTAAAAATVALGALPFTARAQTTTSGKMKIGIVGSGRVGSALGGAWVRAGHDVMFSSLNLEQDKKLAASLGPNAHAGTPREAAVFGTVLLIAVPYSAMPSVSKDLADLIKGKIIIDPSNPLPRDGDVGVAAREKGAGLASMEYLPGARIVRAFNAVGAARMAEAAGRSERMGMPIAGDDQNAIATASNLIRDVGYEPVLVGSLAAMGKHLIPGTPLAGERSPEQIRQIAATLK